MSLKLRIRCPYKKQVLGTLYVNQTKGKVQMEPMYLRFKCPHCCRYHKKQKTHWVDWRTLMKQQTSKKTMTEAEANAMIDNMGKILEGLLGK